MAKKTWVAVDCCCHTNSKVLALAELLRLDIDATVGKLVRLWSWAKLLQNEDGIIGRIPDEELAAIMRWRKKPATLVDALINTGFLESDLDGRLTIHGWYEINGRATEKARKDRERKA